MITTLLRFAVLTGITGFCSFTLCLIAGRLAVAVGLAETSSVFDILKLSGGITILSTCLGMILWRSDL